MFFGCSSAIEANFSNFGPVKVHRGHQSRQFGTADQVEMTHQLVHDNGASALRYLWPCFAEQFGIREDRNQSASAVHIQLF